MPTLGHMNDAQPGSLVGLKPAERDPVELNNSGAVNSTRDRLQQRCLACAVRADNADEFVFHDRDGDLGSLKGRSWDAVVDPSAYVIAVGRPPAS